MEHTIKFRIRKDAINKVQELLDSKYSNYNISQVQLIKLSIIGYGITQDKNVLNQTLSMLKEHNVKILNLSLNQSKIEIVSDNIENELIDLLHKKLIRKEEM